MTQRELCRAAVILLCMVSLVRIARAHPLDPALLEIHESADGTLDVRWQRPVASSSETPFEPILPAACTALGAPTVTVSGPRATLHWEARCDAQGLVGQAIGV